MNIKKEILVTSFVIIHLLSCSHKSLVDISRFNSNQSIFYKEIVGRINFDDLNINGKHITYTDNSEIIEIMRDGTFFQWHETWGNLIRCYNGRWALNDSFLYLNYYEKKDHTNQAGIWEKDTGQVVFKIFEINSKEVTFTVGRKDKYCYSRKSFLNDTFGYPCKK